MDGRLTLSPHPAVRLAEDPTWSEDPLGDRNWQFQYHSLRFVSDLFPAWRTTGDARYLDRALFLLRDWIRDNPRSAPASPFSWNDHSTAWRTIVLACALEIRPGAGWLRDALAEHGRTLASDAFYVRHGNHALNQDRGLLAAGCALGRTDWQRLAARRLAALVVESIDRQGVTNEQAVFYEWYNFDNYREAEERLRQCDVPVPAAFARVDRMPDFLAHSTLPDGTHTTLGDTPRSGLHAIPGTVAEFVATAGASGPRPERPFARYDAGFVFGRTGWGESRPFRDEAAYSLRFGPGRAWHGHDDGASVTLYGYGSRLVDDPGTFTLNYDAWRDFAIGRSAHNVVTVDGLAYSPSTRTRLVHALSGETRDDLLVTNGGYPGVDLRRRVLFSRALGYLVVEDRVTAGATRTFRQLWHLEPGSAPRVDGATVRTTRSGGNVTIVQLAARPRTTVVEGRRRPVQGWISERVGSRIAAPTVEASLTGRSARYLTVVVPTAGPDVSVSISHVVLRGSSWSFRIDIDGVGEQVSATAEGSTISPLP